MRSLIRIALPFLLGALTLATVPAHPASAMGTPPPGSTPLQTTLPSPGEVHLTHVEAGQSGLLASGDPNTLFYARDLTTWEPVSLPMPITRILDLVWSGDRWVVAAEGAAGLVVLQSENHQDWSATPISPTVPKGPIGLSVGGNSVWLASDAGLWSAPAGSTNWAPIPTPSGFYPRAVAVATDNAIVVGRVESGGGAILRLAPEGTWTELAKTPESLKTIVYSEGQFLAGGSVEPNPNGQLWRSTDGLHWTASTPWPVDELKVAPGFGFIALPTVVGSRRGPLWSRDGETWVYGYAGPYHIYDATWVSGRILAVGSSPGQTFAFGPFCAPYIDFAAADSSCAGLKGLTSTGIIRGLPGFRLEPGYQFTRGQLAAVLLRYKGYTPTPGDPQAQDWSVREGWYPTALQYNLIQPGDSWSAPERGELLKTVMQAAGIQPLPNVDTGYADILLTDPLAPWIAGARQAKLIGAEAPFPIWLEPTFGPHFLPIRIEAIRLLANLPH